MGADYLFVFVSFVLLATTALVMFRVRRRFDVFSVSYVGCCAYFLPMFAPAPDWYATNFFVYWAILSTVSLTALVFDHRRVTNAIPSTVMLADARYGSFFIVACAILSATLLAIQVYAFGWQDFVGDKQLQERSGEIHFLYVTLVSLGTVGAYAVRSRLLAYFGASVLLVTLTGDRTMISILLLALLLSHFSQQPNRIGNFLSVRMLGVLGILLLVGVYGKLVYGAATLSFATDLSYLDAIRTLSSYTQDYSPIELLQATEPYHVDSMLGWVLRDGFSVDRNYLLDAPVHLLPFSGRLVDSTHFFSAELKAHYFSGWSDAAGVGASYWAEGYATFGAAGIALFLGLFVAVLYLLNALFWKFSPFSYWRWMISVMAVYWGFYLHRNSLFQMVAHEKRILYVCLVVVAIVALAARSRTRRVAAA